MGLSASKRVKNSLENSGELDSVIESAFAECLSLTQHGFEGVLPYQLKTASDYIHANTSQPLIKKWVPAPPDRSQVDWALRRVTSSDSDPLGRLLFKKWAHQLYTEAVLSGAKKALMVRVPVGVVGILGIGAVTRPAPPLLATVVGAYSVGVALSIFLPLSA